ncbi:MAG: S9 family peptidase [Muribaculaceae bacterium]
MKYAIISKIILAMCVVYGFSVQAFTLQDAVLGNYRPEAVGELISTADGESYLQIDNSGTKIDKISFKTGSVIETVFNATTARSSKIKECEGFALSSDESKLLIYTNSQKIYRNSFKADYYVYDIRHNNLKPLSLNGAQEAATFSPDGRMVAFVRNNNIYIKKIDYDTEVEVTTDGAKNKIINGVPDWVYQEEFGMLSSLTWSSDNLMLSFIRWNEENVSSYSFPLYKGACEPKDEYNLYPGRFEYKYPVAGTANSEVSVISYDVETRKLKELKIPMLKEDYIPQIKFSPIADRLMVMTLNRHQNKLQIYATNPRSTVSKLVYTDESQSWIEIEDVTNMVRYNEASFVVASEKSGFNHLYEYSNAGIQIRQLTKGDWSVTDYYGYDSLLKVHYFQSTQNSPLDRCLSKVDAKGLITKISQSSGTYSAQFNSTYTYYINNFSDLKTPNQYTLWTNKGKQVREILMNKEYATKYTASDIPQKEFFKCQSEGETLNGYMIKPVNFDSSKKYPVIMSQYSGPSSQQVLNSWKIDWEQYAATQGYIVACVDGRGTGGRGKAWKSTVYMQLGKYESIDQISAAKYMASQKYVDSSKIGIYGWSYGGYETLMAMSQPNSNYAAGVAVAPVTDWRYYDSVYAERFMRTPKENETGYNQGSPLNLINYQKGKLLIMAGTADDNVHIANTLQYTSELTMQNKICDMMIYTNMNHSINGCDTRYPLYKKILDFFDNHLKR